MPSGFAESYILKHNPVRSFAERFPHIPGCCPVIDFKLSNCRWRGSTRGLITIKRFVKPAQPWYAVYTSGHFSPLIQMCPRLIVVIYRPKQPECHMRHSCEWRIWHSDFYGSLKMVLATFILDGKYVKIGVLIEINLISLSIYVICNNFSIYIG